MATRRGAADKGERTPSVETINKIGRFIAGMVVLVLGALMVADAVVTYVANTPFMFTEGLNRGFEFVVGLIAIILAGTLMDESRR